MPVVNLRTSKCDVKIDRTTKFGNPFVMKYESERDYVVLKHLLWLNTQPDLLLALPELKDKDLGCWCFPKSCHGDELQRQANSRWIRNWFSNMLVFDQDLVYQGIKYNSVENFYQTMKLPKDRVDLRQQIAYMTPHKAKVAIRDKNKYKWSDDWTKDKSLEVMAHAIAHKFKKGTRWATKLMMTEDWEITEWNNWNDLFWGKDIASRKGENHLGRILMEQRAKL